MEQDKERYEEAQKIVETFVEQFSPKEINIGMESRKEVLKLFEDSSVDHCPANLFDDAVTDVLIMMKNDQFKRFISMKEFTELVRRVPEEKFQSFAKLK
jgi:ssDNA-binding replication factor A large subunit